MAGCPPDVLTLFTDLAAIPSPSGKEGKVAEQVIAWLHELGIDTVEDDAGPNVQSDSGNLLARIEATDKGGLPIFLCGHLDTVPPAGPIRPIVANGIVRNAAETILGADNKAAVAVMIESARRIISEARPHAGLELLFTVQEERGHLGAKAFNLAALHARTGFVYDCVGPIGNVVIAAPYKCMVEVKFFGRSAHAGFEPEKGRSAILGAARAIAALRLGRIDYETTANIGTIEGGTGHNIVPDQCALTSDTRSLDEDKLSHLLKEMEIHFQQAARVTGCEVVMQVDRTYDGYRLSLDDPLPRLACAALERVGRRPRAVVSGGGSDASTLVARGVECLNLANGMKHVHTPDECVAVADLEEMVNVTLALVDEARGVSSRH